MARERLALAALLAALSLAASHSARAEPRGVRLLGTVVSSDPAHSLAMIEKGGGQLVLRTGGELDGAEVLEIRSESVLLRRGGQLETLRLASLSRPVGRAGAESFPASPDAQDDDSAHPPTSAAAPSAPRPSAPRGRRPARSSSSTARAPAAAASEKEIARSNDEMLAELAAQARFAPVMDDDGKLRGIALMNVVSDSMLERLGLQSDDVLVKVQGVPIDSSGQAMNVARSLDRSKPVRLDLERHGVPVVVNVDPRSLYRR